MFFCSESQANIGLDLIVVILDFPGRGRTQIYRGVK